MDTPSENAANEASAAAVAAPVETAAPRHDVLAPGTIVAERYRVVSLIGEGGMGAVYRVEHVHMRKAFALKVLQGELLTSAEAVARFEREAVAAAAIDHPNVVTATDFGKLADGACFLVLELIDGRDLRSSIEVGRFDPARAKNVARGIAAAMAAAHDKGIIHRDLKPENVMLVSRDGDDDFVKVLDFGIAKIAVPDAPAANPAQDAKPLTRVGAVIGTPEYMAPEQALAQPVDARTDLYSLGVIFYELLAGTRPFGGNAMDVLRKHMLEPPPPMPPEVVAAADPRLLEIVGKLLAKDPAHRFDSAKDLVVALDAIDQKVAHAPTILAVPGVSTGVSNVSNASTAVTTMSALQATALRIWNGHRRAVAIGGGALVLLLLVLIARGTGSDERAAKASTRDGSKRTETSNTASTASTDSPNANAAATAPAKRQEVQPLPPPPPSATVATPTPSASASASAKEKPAGRGRRTGPGGIYVPPPNTWFK